MAKMFGNPGLGRGLTGRQSDKLRTQIMISAEAPAVIRFKVENCDDMTSQIERFESYLRLRARAHDNRGILVTRHSPYDFTMELHPDVPFGTTREQQEW